MKTELMLAAAALALLMTGCHARKNAAGGSPLVTEKDKYSYALGSQLGAQMRNQVILRDSVDLDLDIFLRAFRDRFFADSASFLMDDSLVEETMRQYTSKLLAEQTKRDSITAAKFKADGEAFLARNKRAEGVMTRPSGLQYKVLVEGTGATPTDADKVKVHYTGTLLDGTKFDSSYDRGEPLEFPVTAVIPGWTEMLKLMQAGGKVVAWVPSELAYGPKGNRLIPGNAVLKFEIELLDVIPSTGRP